MLGLTLARSPIGASASKASQSSPPEWQNARSAASKLQGSCDFIVPNFMVLLRGSKTARIRPPWAPRRRRKPSNVVRMAVGWCAKSS